MITISTSEKWLEMDCLENPIKATNNVIWLGLSLNKRGKVIISFDFGVIIESEFHSRTAFDYELAKTDEEIKAYSYDQLHNDAKSILESICLSTATFTIS